MKKKTRIRAKNVDMIKKYKEYRDAGLTYAEITAILGKEKRQFGRWNEYIRRGVLGLSTVR